MDLSIPENLNHIIEELSTEFPNYLLKLLVACGWDNISSLSQLADAHIEDMEKFAREDLPLLLEENEKKVFFGIYAKQPHLFKISAGHKQLLACLSAHCKSQVETKRNKRRSCRCEKPSEEQSPRKKLRSHNNNYSHDSNIENESRARDSENDGEKLNKNKNAKEHITLITRKYIQAVLVLPVKEEITTNAFYYRLPGSEAFRKLSIHYFPENKAIQQTLFQMKREIKLDISKIYLIFCNF